MRITRVESWRRSISLTRPYTIASGTFEAVDLFFVRISSDDGRQGVGSASPADFVTGETDDACQEALQPERLDGLLGRDPRQPPSLVPLPGDPHSPTPAARAAVDMALWDLHGRCLGKSVVDILGRRHESLPTSITLGISSVEESLLEAEERVGRGFRHLKVKLGRDPELDLERLRQLRDRFGDRVEIRVDVNQGYEPPAVARLLAAADELGLELVEQPLERGREEALRSLAPRTRTPLAADESLHGTTDALVWAEADSPYRVFNIKLMKCGGISPALAISAVADTASRDLMWGCMDESRISITAALHVAYACPRTRYLDLDGSLDLARDPGSAGFALRDGRLYLLEEPGLGVQLEPE